MRATIGGLLALATLAAAQIRLENGKPEHRRIEGGPDSFTLGLNKGEYIEILAEQTSLDIALRLRGPDGKQIQEVNHLGIGGTELMIQLADSDGQYILEARSAHEGVSGDYTVTLAVRRMAQAKDREVAEADERFRELLASNSSDSVAKMEEMADLFGRLGVTRRQARALRAAGVMRMRVSSSAQAIENWNRSLGLWRILGDRGGEWEVLDQLGHGYLMISQPEKATGYLDQALGIAREIHDRSGEATVLNDIGAAYSMLSEHEKQISYAEQSLPIAREAKNRIEEAQALNLLGSAYNAMSQYEKAIAYWNQDFEIFHAIGSRGGEGQTLHNLACAYFAMGQYEQAIKYWQQGLDVARAIPFRPGEGRALQNLGIAYYSLSQYDKAIGYFEQALPIFREVKARSDEGNVLNDLGHAYVSTGHYEKAGSYYEQALAVARDVHDRAGEARALGSLGDSNSSAKRYEKAIEYYQHGISIFREIKNRAAEGNLLNLAGDAYDALGRRENAVGYHEQALSIAREVKSRADEHASLDSLVKSYQALNQPRLSIFYGKQAVNVIQSIRADIQGLNEETRKSFVESKKDTYRRLADILVSQGRLVEAQQVLNLLKDQEFFDYVRRDERAAGPSGRADLTSEESEWAERYRGASETLVAKGAEMEELRERMKQQPSLAEAPDTQRQLEELERDLETGNRAFQQFLTAFKQHFAAKAEASATAIDLRDTEALKADLGELKHGAVAIYTLVTPERYVAILITPHVQRAYETRIKSEDLNQKIFAFREAIADPDGDPLPQAQQLYHIMIPEALASDLKQARAETLMWSLDGPLRYVPVAALHDGKHYLIENYRTAVFTPASKARLKEAPQTSWRGMAFGVSEAHPGFEALPAVADELRSIIRENPGEPGVLDGRRLMDAQFTRASLDRSLALAYPVVHVASHFQFRPGDETRSFLLLGDGGELTLADLKAADTIFAGVDLLTLSACSTGLGDVKSSDGSEVEGFGVLAQRKGAKSVIASLWPVADQSTGLLMRELYRVRESNASITKVEALRRAQLRLLRGEINSSSAESVASSSVKTRDYRHPYYWAPFFLMGNWL